MRHKSKGLTAVFMLLTAIMLLTVGCASMRTTLTVGIDEQFPPFSYRNEAGEYVGFDVELARAVGELEGWEVRLESIPWDEKDTKLNSGSIDCIWSGVTIHGRENDYTFSRPYVNNCYTVIVGKESAIEEKEDLQDKVVGVQVASTAADYLINNKEGKELSRSFGLLTQFSDYQAVLEVLERGAIDAVVVDLGTAHYYMEKKPDQFRVLPVEFLKDHYGVAFKKGNKKLCEMINNDLKKLAENGTISELAKKYGISEYIRQELLPAAEREKNSK